MSEKTPKKRTTAELWASRDEGTQDLTLWTAEPCPYKEGSWDGEYAMSIWGVDFPDAHELVAPDKPRRVRVTVELLDENE